MIKIETVDGIEDYQIKDTVLFTDDTDENLVAENATFQKMTADELKEELTNDITGFLVADFGDCWLKTMKKPTREDWEIFSEKETGLTFDEISILEPGTHPGGNFYWINPVSEIVIPIYKKENN